MTRRRSASRVAIWLSLAATIVIAGCGGATDDLPRQAISGEVKMDGSPVKSALIQFMPTDPGLATAGAAAVTDGRYTIPAAEGLVPGAYTVSVTSSSAPAAAQATAVMPGDPLPPAKESIPSTYNSKTTLTAQVTPEGPNTFNFELKRK
jgi:hypothetical protein